MTTFTVYGPAATKGSTVSFVSKGRVVTKADCGSLATWTRAVGWSALSARVPLAPKGTGVVVGVQFYFKRPDSAAGRVHHVTKPDLDKLARALLDALTGIAYDDDSQVVRLTVAKYYASAAYTTVSIKEV